VVSEPQPPTRGRRRARQDEPLVEWRTVRTAAFWVGVVLVALAPAVYLAVALGGGDAKRDQALDGCVEPKAARAAPPGQIELQANRARPTLAIALADRPSASDTIAFSTKGRQFVPPESRARTSAVLLETPRRAPAERFDGAIGVKAEPWVGGTVVRVSVCVSRGAVLKAGAFQGTVRVYGPRVDDFDYAVIVTEKWPWEVPVAILWYAGLAFVIVAWRTGSLAFAQEPGDSTKRNFISVTAGLAVGLAAMVPTFFGTYWNNPTWGSEPGTQVVGLAAAGLTAALAGLAAAKRVLGGPSHDDGAG
jgi:hypothetical protein